MWRWRQRLEAGTVGATRSHERGPELPERTNLANTLVLDFRLQNCERIHSCCFKPAHLW